MQLLTRLTSRAAVLVVLLSACGMGSEARWDAVRQDPMATVALPSSPPPSVSESAGSTGGTGSPARVRRTFAVGSLGVEGTVEALARQAREAGWVLVGAQGVPGFTGEKRTDGVLLQLVISASAADGVAWIEVYSQQGN